MLELHSNIDVYLNTRVREKFMVNLIHRLRRKNAESQKEANLSHCQTLNIRHDLGQTLTSHGMAMFDQLLFAKQSAFTDLKTRSWPLDDPLIMMTIGLNQSGSQYSEFPENKAKNCVVYTQTSLAKNKSYYDEATSLGVF